MGAIPQETWQLLSYVVVLVVNIYTSQYLLGKNKSLDSAIIGFGCLILFDLYVIIGTITKYDYNGQFSALTMAYAQVKENRVTIIVGFILLLVVYFIVKKVYRNMFREDDGSD